MEKKQILVRAEAEILQQLQQRIDEKLGEYDNIRMDAAGAVITELLSGQAEPANNDGVVDALTLKLDGVKAELENTIDELKGKQEELAAMEAAYNRIKQFYNEKLACIIFELIKSQDDECKDVTDVESAVNYIFRPYWDAEVLVPDEDDIRSFREMMGGAVL